MEINTNNDSLDYMIRRRVRVLSANDIYRQTYFKGVGSNLLTQRILEIREAFNTLFESVNKEETRLFYLSEETERNGDRKDLLKKLSQILTNSTKMVEYSELYSAHILAVYILSIFCLIPSIMERGRVYRYLRELRKEFVI